jgi:hypothetical protein
MLAVELYEVPFNRAQIIVIFFHETSHMYAIMIIPYVPLLMHLFHGVSLNVMILKHALRE